MKTLFAFILAAFFLAGCTTTPDAPECEASEETGCDQTGTTIRPPGRN